MSVRANKKAISEKHEKIAKTVLKFIGVIFVLCVICFPVTMYEFINDVLIVIKNGFVEAFRFFMRDYV